MTLPFITHYLKFRTPEMVQVRLSCRLSRANNAENLR